MSDITVILTAYRRPALLRPQVAAVRAQSVPARAVWLWANQPDAAMLAQLEGLGLDRVVLCSDNAGVHPRFSLVLNARTEFVAVFDDDALPGPEWFANCLRTMKQTPGILGSAGVTLTGNLYRTRRLHGWHDPSPETVEVDLVGHAWFLRTEWIKHLFDGPAVVGSNGEDIELAARAWRRDKICCYCPPHPADNRAAWGSTHGAEHGSDAVAASRRPDHLDERDRVVRAEVGAGWVPLRFRHRRPPIMPARPLESGSWEITEEVVDCLAPTACRILELGCDGSSLKRQLDQVRHRCERFVAVRTAEMALHRSAPEEFDCIVCRRPDAVTDPARLLRQAKSWLRPGGELIACFPTARHHSLVRALFEGDWGLELPGLLGPEQVRLFTRREAEKLLYRAGYAVKELRTLPGEGHQAWVQRGRPNEVRVGAMHTTGLSAEDAEEFYAEGILARAVPVAAVDFGLTSLVVVTFNELAYTRLCIDSVRLRTDEPYELIFVDNGSTDGTVEYLESLADVKVIRNAVNRGFPAAANQGIAAASGRQVLLLNNDTLVTTGWLGRMLRVLHSDSSIGLVGPCSNCVSGEQQVEVGYEQLEDLDGFAWDWGKDRAGVRADTDRLVGFCLLIRRELIEAIGVLDERFGIGCFDDDDYCLRALRGRFRAVIAGDSFVHHFGGRTFKGSGVDFGTLMRRNQQRFEEKWVGGGQGTAETAVDSSSTRPYSARETEGGLVLVRATELLTLCMIARDNARTIRPALESIRKHVDRMIVVDTGSRDETPQIAASLGAQVFHFPWCDDFAAARNESLRHAPGRWVFWMDTDDVIDEANGRNLRKLAYQPAPADVLGYVVSVHCPGAGPADPQGFTCVTHVKLFRNLPHLRFEHRIHEQILPAIQRAGGKVEFTPLFVVHSGYDTSVAGQKRKLERDMRLLHLELHEQPEHPFTLFNLGMTYTDAGRHREAIAFLRRCLERSAEGSSHTRKAYSLLVSCHESLREAEQAEQVCQRGLEVFPLDDELRFRRANLLHGRGRLREAVEAYEDLLSRREDVHFTSVVAGVRGNLARQNLAVVYREMGELARAEEQLREILKEAPEYKPALQGLEEVIRFQGTESP